uniref:Uncharacterized protein n=1 Tax=Physcomitrium patens TaxID=3218 RepID=A0A2K1K6Q4_PHYPA|nr:hypothetical protein PHYPA_011352 [Physcomitrium patens]
MEKDCAAFGIRSDLGVVLPLLQIIKAVTVDIRRPAKPYRKWQNPAPLELLSRGEQREAEFRRCLLQDDGDDKYIGNRKDTKGFTRKSVAVRPQPLFANYFTASICDNGVALALDVRCSAKHNHCRRLIGKSSPGTFHPAEGVGAHNSLSPLERETSIDEQSRSIKSL